MSIGKRLFNFARSELNSLLDRAAEIDDPTADPDAYGVPDRDSDDSSARPAAAPPRPAPGGRRKVRLEDLSDEELEAEIERRKLDREIDERAAQAAARAPRGQTRAGGRSSTSSSSSSSGASGRTSADPIARAYAALEVPVGSDFETVRKAYRSMMRKYHPDRHTATPEKQKASNELAQKLTDAYKTLEKRLRK